MGLSWLLCMTNPLLQGKRSVNYRGAFVRVDVRSGRLRIDQAGLGEREGESEECEAVIRGSWSRVYIHLLCDEYTVSAH